jgi:hypothetical protein
MPNPAVHGLFGTGIGGAAVRDGMRGLGCRGTLFLLPVSRRGVAGRRGDVNRAPPLGGRVDVAGLPGACLRDFFFGSWGATHAAAMPGRGA